MTGCNEPPIVNRSGDVLVQGLSGGKEVGRRDVAQRAVLAVLVVEADEVSDGDPGLVDSLVDGRPDLLFLQRAEVALDDGVLLGLADVDEGELNAEDVQRLSKCSGGWLAAPSVPGWGETGDPPKLVYEGGEGACR